MSDVSGVERSSGTIVVAVVPPTSPKRASDGAAGGTIFALGSTDESPHAEAASIAVAAKAKVVNERRRIVAIL
jgi:hypothetical protein